MMNFFSNNKSSSQYFNFINSYESFKNYNNNKKLFLYYNLNSKNTNSKSSLYKKYTLNNQNFVDSRLIIIQNIFDLKLIKLINFINFILFFIITYFTLAYIYSTLCHFLLLINFSFFLKVFFLIIFYSFFLAVSSIFLVFMLFFKLLTNVGFLLFLLYDYNYFFLYILIIFLLLNLNLKFFIIFIFLNLFKKVLFNILIISYVTLFKLFILFLIFFLIKLKLYLFLTFCSKKIDILLNNLLIFLNKFYIFFLNYSCNDFNKFNFVRYPLLANSIFFSSLNYFFLINKVLINCIFLIKNDSLRLNNASKLNMSFHNSFSNFYLDNKNFKCDLLVLKNNYLIFNFLKFQKFRWYNLDTLRLGNDISSITKFNDINFFNDVSDVYLLNKSNYVSNLFFNENYFMLSNFYNINKNFDNTFSNLNSLSNINNQVSLSTNLKFSNFLFKKNLEKSDIFNFFLLMNDDTNLLNYNHNITLSDKWNQSRYIHLINNKTYYYYINKNYEFNSLSYNVNYLNKELSDDNFMAFIF